MSHTFVFENENFIAVDKPSGVLTTPSRFGQKDERRVLGLELQEQMKRQIFPVHRLDFEVSGLVLFALNAPAHKWANTAFEGRHIKKIYQALSPRKTESEMKEFQAEQEWRSLLVRGKKRSFEADYGKEAVTRAQILEEKGQFCLWRLSPLTGKSHQLRFEMTKQGFPIVGDSLYGSQIPYQSQAIALRAVSVDFSQLTERKKWGLPDALEIFGLYFPK